MSENCTETGEISNQSNPKSVVLANNNIDFDDKIRYLYRIIVSLINE